MNAFTIENCRSVMNVANDMNQFNNDMEIYRQRFQRSFNNPGSLSDGPMWNNGFNFLNTMYGF